MESKKESIPKWKNENEFLNELTNTSYEKSCG